MCTDNFTTNETRNAILPANNNPQTDDDFARVLAERDEARAAAVDMRRERDAKTRELQTVARILDEYALLWHLARNDDYDTLERIINEYVPSPVSTDETPLYPDGKPDVDNFPYGRDDE